MRSRSTVQSPAAYDAANLQGPQIAARMSSDEVTARIVASVTATTRSRMKQALQDAGHRYEIAPAETAAGLTESDLTFGYDLGNIRRYGAVADNATDDTAALQAFFTACEAATLPAIVPRGYYLTGPVELGNPETADDLSGSGQAPGVFCIEGEHRDTTTFMASDDAAGATLLKRHNLAGVTIRGISVDGNSKAAQGLDLTWTYAPYAPSCQNILEDIAAFNCTVVGINLDGMHDSKIIGIRTFGSPIGLSLKGGGGQMSLSNSAISGVLQCSAQNLEISQSVALSGIDINGNTDNRIRISGTQVFPLPTVAQISSDKWGYCIAAQDSGSYGANLVLDTGHFFGGSSGVLVGKFASLHARNAVFDWSGGNFFGSITTGLAHGPHFVFEDCDFRGDGATGPVAAPPAVGTVELRRCYIDGTYYEYYNSAEEVDFTPQIVSEGNLSGTGNTYTRQVGKARICGNVVHHFIDVILDSVGVHSGAVLVSGLVGTPNEEAVGGGAPILVTNIALPTNCSQFGLEMQKNSDKAVLYGFGGTAGAPAATNAGALVTGARIKAVITTRRR